MKLTYNEFEILVCIEKEKRELAQENTVLKNEVRNLKSSIEAARIGEKEICFSSGRSTFKNLANLAMTEAEE